MKYRKSMLALVLAASLFAEPALPAQAVTKTSKANLKTAVAVRRMRILRVKKKKLLALIRRSVQQQEMNVLKQQVLSYLTSNGLSTGH